MTDDVPAAPTSQVLDDYDALCKGQRENTSGSRLVVIESPYAGQPIDNIAYLHRCIRECALRGDSPYASHLMLTTALDDNDADERTLGIALGLEFRRRVDMRIFYVDRGWSRGMTAALDIYNRDGLPYEVRKLGALIKLVGAGR